MPLLALVGSDFARTRDVDNFQDEHRINPYKIRQRAPAIAAPSTIAPDQQGACAGGRKRRASCTVPARCKSVATRIMVSSVIVSAASMRRRRGVTSSGRPVNSGGAGTNGKVRLFSAMGAICASSNETTPGNSTVFKAEAERNFHPDMGTNFRDPAGHRRTSCWPPRREHSRAYAHV